MPDMYCTADVTSTDLFSLLSNRMKDGILWSTAIQTVLIINGLKNYQSSKNQHFLLFKKLIAETQRFM
jgi:hypothetical protein